MDHSNNRKKGRPRQKWNPHWSLKILYGLWSTALAALKIALGAVATVLLICVVCGFVFVGILGNYLQDDVLPEAYYNMENANLDQTSFVYYVDDGGNIQLLQQIHTSADRQWASLDEIPDAMVKAAVAIEDKRFYEHQGVDWITTVKACANLFFGGDDKFGGSTLTQQLLKNLTGEDSVTVQRKVQEILTAQCYEKIYDKDFIMEWYLNTIYLGRGCYGVKSAAAEYFGKELRNLTVAECASLISITNNPSIFNPYSQSVYMWEGAERNGAERNRVRQLTVLGEMKDQGWITEEEYEEAKNQELVFKKGIAPEDKWAVCENSRCGYEGTVGTYQHEGSAYYCPKCGTQGSVTTDSSQEVYSYFVDTVLEDVAADLAAQVGIDWNTLDKEAKDNYMLQIQRGGYHIFSTLDKHVQDQVDAIYSDPANIAKTRSKQQLQSAMVIIDISTGDIVAMAGGVGEKTTHNGWNIATDSKLQTGSAMKPVAVYAPAFESGAISPATVILDLPVSYSGGAFPKNDNRTYSYSRTVLSGITNSVNAVSVRTLREIGYDYSYEFAKEKLRLHDLTNHYVTSNGSVKSDLGDSPLGMGALTVGATVRDMAAAYATFASDGLWREARTYTKVYDSDGNLVLDNTQESEQVLSEKTVNYMNYCLQNAVNSGTGGEARISGQNVAGKTGTTSSNRDRWFCGYTKHYAAAVWCGYHNPEVIRITSGENNPAAVLFRKVLQPLHNGLEKKALYSTSEFRGYSMCLDTGAAATSICERDLRTYLYDTSRTASAYAYKGDGPSGTCNRHVLVDYCSGGGVATGYCYKFADVTNVSIESRALLKMTPSEVRVIEDALGAGLKGAFGDDRYVYYVSESGSELDWHGFNGDANRGISAPYVMCPEHTLETWEAYLAEQAAKETEPEIPSVPEINEDIPTVPVIPDVQG
ncbi:MAG: transglycosylase domain-containing protein [Oscillospiraceae bacterium]|nr:transglycosylase domain-containing protein [Oscillospiraceae bacterium]